MVYKSLVIGCGNIGALYDFDKESILTHVKAFHHDKRFTLSVHDIDKTLARKVSNKYDCEVVTNINEDILRTFDCVSICTPTHTHYNLLKQAIDAKVKLIICEKPVSKELKELNAVKKLYPLGRSKILINYIRRFQPAYIGLRRRVLGILKNESLTNVSIRYQKGFLNNCSHAIDTIEFLTNCPVAFKSLTTHNKKFDHFPDDATISLQALWNNANVSITGLTNIQFSYFEIDLYFEYSSIAIKNAGATVHIYQASKGPKKFPPLHNRPLLTREDCLKDYMKHVINHAYALLSGNEKSDNFLVQWI